jgi:hypothetical protein
MPTPCHGPRATMYLSDIVAHTFRFHRAVYISLTQKCPIKCAHCFVESGPEREETSDLSEFRQWIDSLLNGPDMDILFFSGGEPYSHPRALRYGLERCAVAGRYSVVATSAFWAKDKDVAGRFLDHFPYPRCLCISTDIYHERFVPLSYVRTAAEVAQARGVHVTIQITKSPTGYVEFMERYEREVPYDLIAPSEIFIAEFSSVGRATSECRRAETADQDIPAAPCVWLGTPWLHEDGTLCACPNLAVFERQEHPLRIGNLSHEDFAAVSKRANENYYIQALRVFGPKGLIEQFPLEQWGWSKSDYAGVSICDLCHSIASVPGIPNRIQEAVARGDLAQRITALRLAYYGELSKLNYL